MKHNIMGVFIGLLLIVATLPVMGVSHVQTTSTLKGDTSAISNQNILALGFIGINIVATVTEVNDPDNLLDGAIQVNETITGKYVYNPKIPDNSSDPHYGIYLMTSSPCGFEVNAGGFVFRTNQSDVYIPFLTYNDCLSPLCDEYIMYSLNNQPLSNGMVVKYISWELIDYNCTALSSDALPTKAPVLADWEQPVGLQLIGSDPEDPYKAFDITAHVTKATKNNRIDLYDVEHTWTTSSMIIPASYNIPVLRFWERIFERAPHAFPILRHLMGY